jgi:hypothetical protein
LIPINRNAKPDTVNTIPAIDNPGVILGFNGSGLEGVVAVPFVAVLTAVVEGVRVLLIVAASPLWEAVFDKEAEFKLNGVVMAD